MKHYGNVLVSTGSFTLIDMAVADSLVLLQQSPGCQSMHRNFVYLMGCIVFSRSPFFHSPAGGSYMRNRV